MATSLADHFTSKPISCNGAPGWEEAAAGSVPVHVGGGLCLASDKPIGFTDPTPGSAGSGFGIRLKAPCKKRALPAVPLIGTAGRACRDLGDVELLPVGPGCRSPTG